MMWYWTLEKDSVWTLNSDGTTSGRALDDPEYLAWLEAGNTPEPWEATNGPV